MLAILPATANLLHIVHDTVLETTVDNESDLFDVDTCSKPTGHDQARDFVLSQRSMFLVLFAWPLQCVIVYLSSQAGLTAAWPKKALSSVSNICLVWLIALDIALASWTGHTKIRQGFNFILYTFVQGLF